jgi:hypothetical protein
VLIDFDHSHATELGGDASNLPLIAPDPRDLEYHRQAAADSKSDQGGRCLHQAVNGNLPTIRVFSEPPRVLGRFHTITFGVSE